MYPLSSVVDTLELALKQSGTTDEITEGISLLRTNIMCSLGFEILEIFRLMVSFLCPPPPLIWGFTFPIKAHSQVGDFESLEHD